MNPNRKKHVAFCYPLRISGKQFHPPRKPVSSMFLNPAVLKGLTQTQKNYLKSIMKIYDSKPQWKSLQWQYILGLIYKYMLGYISKKDVLSYMAVMDQYIKNGPLKCKTKKRRCMRNPTPTSSRKSLSSRHTLSLSTAFRGQDMHTFQDGV
ncbi:protein FAM216B [Notamacropus eugenii]|uniref:protein FAM216B n=1 Tax=Notamacropus eugenii TaxID=9315 RepID=UPI003B66B2E2